MTQPTSQPAQPVSQPARKDVPLDVRVVQMIAQLTTVRESEIRPEDRLREDLGLDSVCSMELLSMLAEEYDLDIAVEEAMQITTVSAAVQMARKHLGQQAT
jgi:acyl carrier protein